MDLYEAIYQRMSIRNFDSSREISDEVVEKLLEAAVQAPSAGNIQPWRFWVARDPQTKEGLVQAALGQSFIAEAPVAVVVCADLAVSARGYGDRGVSLYAIQDTAAAIENLLLAVQAEGLGACWVGAFNEERASEILDLPSNIRPLAIIPIGHPLRGEHKPKRKRVEDVTAYL